MIYRSRNNQTGFSLVAAIFLLVILSLLGVYMVSISTVQQQTLSYTFLSTKAYQAARSGIEWGIFRALNDGNCNGFPPGSPKVIDFSGNGLSGFQATVSCTSSSHQEKSNTFNIYQLSSVSKSDTVNFGEQGYVSRVIKMTITDSSP